MKRIAIVTTMWSSINNWIAPFLNDYYANGFEVTLIANMDGKFEEDIKKRFPFVKTYPIDFPRGVNITKSIKSILRLTRYFGKNKFDLVQYSTPNASFYAAIAAARAKIPVRLYCQWGMVFVTMSGLKKLIFRNIEKITCIKSTVIQPDSQANREFCIREKLYKENKSQLIWNGSAKGVDLTVFDVTKKIQYREEIIKRHSLPENSVVIGFVGRLGAEKGCNELFSAFRQLRGEYDNLKLLFVGPIEKTQTIDEQLLRYFYDCDDIIKTDRVNDVYKYVSAMDIFVLPTYREGFGMSVIEASAMGVPVITTEYPGPTNAMKDGVTGIAIKIKSKDAVYDAIKKLLDDRILAETLGNNGVLFAREKFDQTIFRQKLIENRKKLLNIQ